MVCVLHHQICELPSEDSEEPASKACKDGGVPASSLQEAVAAPSWR